MRLVLETDEDDEGRERFPRHHHDHCHPHKDIYILLQIETRSRLHHNLPPSIFAVVLSPKQETLIMSQLHVDQIVTISVKPVDVFGNPVAVQPDGPPTWKNSNEAAAVSSQDASGNEVLTPVPTSVGQTTDVDCSVSIGGTNFTATINEAIVAGAVAGIQLVETFTPRPAGT